MKKLIFTFIFIVVVSFLSATIDYYINDYKIVSYEESNIPSYNGEKYIYINDNMPNFNDADYKSESFEMYSELDEYGRAGVAYANLSKDMMPTKEREDISMIKPTGYKNTKYDFIEGEFLYNRCHLIGYQFTGQNANVKNLITCTREMNSITMLDFENKVANYIRKYNSNVLYRVTPIYEGDNLISKGVQIEASSVSDKCGKICFNVFIYNVQDNIIIDYKTGDNKLMK